MVGKFIFEYINVEMICIFVRLIYCLVEMEEWLILEYMGNLYKIVYEINYVFVVGSFSMVIELKKYYNYYKVLGYGVVF